MPQQDIIGIPAHVIMQGVPFFIMDMSIEHISFIASIATPWPCMIVHTMPLSLMAQVMRQFMGTIMAMGIDGDMPIPMGMDDIIGFIGIAAFIRSSWKLQIG
jgi:hypothetical protein